MPWDRAELAPIVLVRGTEGLLADRAVARLARLAREAAVAAGEAELEVTSLEAAQYEGGRLSVITSPSLFAEPRHVEILGFEAMTDACATDVLAYLADPAPDVTLVIRHGGGVRGKKVLDALVAAKVGQVACDPVADRDKPAFVTAEFSRARRKIAGDGVAALVDAVGSDLRELAAASQQLISDTTGVVTETEVDRYYGGRVEATGFKVADAAVAGDVAAALVLVRHAMASGTPPVPLVAALALKLRTMAKVAASRGRDHGAEVLKGLAPWQVDRARKELAGWTPEGLAAALTATAAADAEVKGESRSPEFAIERAVRRIAAARG
ncbi:DNA polymerase III subunit delta [Litorihabitans aurantiacus]|uniref:DNA-directed DNA polymerase n=1 Tax=Litorihabitans aurantiacus TaxID=1930061 RepID=A0AA37UI21_9MICO|nr:DNA polymerase III subunit delta [Litorihabitans aurantiacus]GMA30939.1 DNA-binding protein [Litorihabitans aurantiacus]